MPGLMVSRKIIPTTNIIHTGQFRSIHMHTYVHVHMHVHTIKINKKKEASNLKENREEFLGGFGKGQEIEK